VAYSKTKVDRAGRILAERVRSVIEGKTITDRSRFEALEAIEIVEWWRGEHARPLSRVGANLRYYAAEQGKPVVAQRLKKTPTISHKLLREPAMKLSRMADIGGVRAVLPTQDAAYSVASRLRRNWTITRFRDYVSEPKADGYRALHLINRNRGRLIEVQLRTQFQDSWANIVEGLSRIFAPDLKFGGGPEELREFLILLSDLGAQKDQGLEVDRVAFAHLQDLRKGVGTLLEESSQ
jgi:putative GTP pyrophosphokinase